MLVYSLNKIARQRLRKYECVDCDSFEQFSGDLPPSFIGCE